MITITPAQLKDYFEPEADQLMMLDIKKYFIGKIRPGLHTIVFHMRGKLAEYYVGFIIDQPVSPYPYIIEVYLGNVHEFLTREEFETRVDKLVDGVEHSEAYRKARSEQPQRVTEYRQKIADAEKRKKN